jgi:hypothetical protein
MMKLTCAASAALMVCSAHAQIVVPPNADPGALQQRRIDEEQRRQELERRRAARQLGEVHRPDDPL